MLCCGYTLTDFPISIRLTLLALWQSNDCLSASKATLMNMDKYFMWIHYERLHNHNKAKHNKTVCIFLGIYYRKFTFVCDDSDLLYENIWSALPINLKWYGIIIICTTRTTLGHIWRYDKDFYGVFIIFRSCVLISKFPQRTCPEFSYRPSRLNKGTRHGPPLNSFGLVTPYGDKDLGRHWPK